MKYFVTGGAGFIGSTLVDRLLADGHSVCVLDDFSTGYRQYLQPAQSKPGFRLIVGDVRDEVRLAEAMRGSDVVFHLAANADVRHGLEHPRRDLEQNTLATSAVLEAMRATNVRAIVFSSTGSIYGEPEVFPTPEDAPFPRQTSLYGASKLACEGLISAYCEGYGMRSWIFRFVSILGERYSHGHVFDFVRQLKKHPDYLDVLGDGRQRKSYLYVQDCVSAMLRAVDQANGKVNIYNLGTEEYCAVNQSIDWITAELGITPTRRYSGGERGWIGDSPFIFLDTSRIRSLGWKPRVTIREGVEHTVRYLVKNPWLLEERA